MNTTTLAAVLLLASPATLRAWSVDEVSLEAWLPAQVSAAWNAEPAGASAKGWDKYHFEDENDEERTVWCRHEESDAAARSGDPGRRVALYYMAPAGPGAFQAVLSVYEMRWAPAKDGGIVNTISRPGTPLDIKASRPWRKDDPWGLPEGALVAPPAGREKAARPSLLAEAVDWPACPALDGKRQPLEEEINEAGTDGASPAQRRSASAKALAEAELAGEPARERFTKFEARFLYCRVKRYDRFHSFRSEMGQAKDPAGFVARWRRFVRGEMAVYKNEAAGARSYQQSLAGVEKRTACALGALPYLAGTIESAHAKTLKEGEQRMDEIMDELR